MSTFAIFMIVVLAVTEILIFATSDIWKIAKNAAGKTMSESKQAGRELYKDMGFGKSCLLLISLAIGGSLAAINTFIVSPLVLIYVLRNNVGNMYVAYAAVLLNLIEIARLVKTIRKANIRKIEEAGDEEKSLENDDPGEEEEEVAPVFGVREWLYAMFTLILPVYNLYIVVVTFTAK
ncbi:hypothetical protein ACFLZ4_01990 [Patescibacteria group bacterium]